MKIVLKGYAGRCYDDFLKKANNVKHLQKEPNLLKNFSPDITAVNIALAIFEHVKFRDGRLPSKKQLYGCYPDWDEIRKHVLVSEEIFPAILLFKQSELDLKITEAIFYIFCLANRRHVTCENNEPTT